MALLVAPGACTIGKGAWYETGLLGLWSLLVTAWLLSSLFDIVLGIDFGAIVSSMPSPSRVGALTALVTKVGAIEAIVPRLVDAAWCQSA